MAIYEVSVYLITDEKLYMKDQEAEFYDDWNDSFKVKVEAATIQEALEKAAADQIKIGTPNWRSVNFDEQTGRATYCHSIDNDEYMDRLWKKYRP